MPIDIEKFVEINAGVGGVIPTAPVNSGPTPPPPVSCTVVAARPLPPYDQAFDLFDDTTQPFPNQQFSGCIVLATYAPIPDPGGTMSIFISSPSATATEFFNYYLFDDTVQIGSVLNTNISQNPFVNVFEIEPAQSVEYVLVIQGVSETDISPADVLVSFQLQSVG